MRPERRRNTFYSGEKMEVCVQGEKRRTSQEKKKTRHDGRTQRSKEGVSGWREGEEGGGRKRLKEAP